MVQNIMAYTIHIFVFLNSLAFTYDYNTILIMSILSRNMSAVSC